jgi:hypothetical protein
MYNIRIIVVVLCIIAKAVDLLGFKTKKKLTCKSMIKENQREHMYLI